MADRRAEYSYYHTHGGGFGEWRIVKRDREGSFGFGLDDENVVWRFPFEEAHWDLDEPPAEVRAKYEELIGYDPTFEDKAMINIVEMMADEDECAFDQPCAYGHRVEGHAVYCHNERWLYSPRKCRRTWYTGGEVRDEDCPGFAPNPRLPAGHRPNTG